MKSNQQVAMYFYAFVLLATVSVNPVLSTFFGGSISVQEQNAHHHSLLMDVYRVFYCSHKHCPPWRCQDDSAVIHGYCCGCPNPMGGRPPVFCVDNLKCPQRMKNLCDDYHFMMMCCGC